MADAAGRDRVNDAIRTIKSGRPGWISVSDLINQLAPGQPLGRSISHDIHRKETPAFHVAASPLGEA
jgi:hypothetical protein